MERASAGQITIYSPQNSNRLEYVLNYLFRERLDIDFRIVHNEADIKDLSFCIAYGRALPNAISIPDAGLLWQKNIQLNEIRTGTWNEIPVLYSSNENGYTLPFDIFSAIFFLLSRYEEYYSYQPDKHGRYPATESILFKNDWLLRPVVDEWGSAFRQILVNKGIAITERKFAYQPTYDIDIAYSYLGKGEERNRGGFFKNLLRFDFKTIKERRLVLEGKLKDPFDSYDWILELHKNSTVYPLYFILAALHNSAYDKNLLPDTIEMHKLIKKLQKNGAICIHPSYYSDGQDTLRREKNVLDVITGNTITVSRQHYIKNKFPDTYRLLLNNGIEADYSMGYGSHLGFRAGTGSGFLWYDIQNEKTERIRIFPFCFMDTTAHYQQKMDVSTAFNQLRSMTAQLKKLNSNLITIFHNFSLGSSAEWIGWKEAYADFIKEINS